jgi:hypothetical protein
VNVYLSALRCGIRGRCFREQGTAGKIRSPYLKIPVEKEGNKKGKSRNYVRHRKMRKNRGLPKGGNHGLRHLEDACVKDPSLPEEG